MDASGPAEKCFVIALRIPGFLIKQFIQSDAFQVVTPPRQTRCDRQPPLTQVYPNFSNFFLSGEGRI